MVVLGGLKAGEQVVVDASEDPAQGAGAAGAVERQWRRARRLGRACRIRGIRHGTRCPRLGGQPLKPEAAA
jgi:hypothetical protein